MKPDSVDNLTEAQNELYRWIKDYMKQFKHSPSIRQMMQAMGLKSPAPIQSRLKHLQEKGFISWQEGKARTLQIVDELVEGVPIMGSVAAGGLIETYSDFQENLNIIADVGIFLYAGKCINFPFLSTKNLGSTIQPLKNWHLNTEKQLLYQFCF